MSGKSASPVWTRVRQCDVLHRTARYSEVPIPTYDVAPVELVATGFWREDVLQENLKFIRSTASKTQIHYIYTLRE